MSTSLASAAQCLGLYDGERIIGFIAVLHQPHPRHKNLKRVSRLVILPDYQGIGLGTKLLNFTAKYWNNKGMDLCIDTSAKNLIASLKKSSNWRMYSYSKTKQSKNGKIDKNRKMRSNAYTGRFMYRS